MGVASRPSVLRAQLAQVCVPVARQADERSDGAHQARAKRADRKDATDLRRPHPKPHKTSYNTASIGILVTELRTASVTPTLGS